MPYILGQMKTSDGNKAIAMIDDRVDTRKAAGCESTTVFRNADDPNELVVLFEWDDLERARQYIKENLQRIEQGAGSVSHEVTFLNEA